MKSANGFSLVAQRANERIRQIARDALGGNAVGDAKHRLLEELLFHEETLKQAFRFRKENGPSLGDADSDAYFSEKLTAEVSFVQMAIDPSQRGGYATEKIIENVDHYSYLVARLVAAKWGSRAEKPATDLAIRDSSFDNREALARLASR